MKNKEDKMNKIEQLKNDLKKAKMLYAKTGYKQYDKSVDKLEKEIKNELANLQR